MIALQGVIEHVDNPFRELRQIVETKLNVGRMVIISSPFLKSKRVCVADTVAAFRYPHIVIKSEILCPFDFYSFAKENGYSLLFRLTDQDGDISRCMIIDFRKRRP